jgi:radical SAM superfamily enzyme YgiQ (UPF0313 family)
MRAPAPNAKPFMPKLLIVQSSAYRSFHDRRPYRIRQRKLIGAVLPYLAALAPPDWDVTLLDDALQEPDYGQPYDVVAISVRTVTSLRAYEIAATFRQRHVPVIMGGPHATFWHEEMAEHADAVCIGEGEDIFPRMLADAAAGRLQKFYRRDTGADLSGLPTPRWDLLDRKRHAFYAPVVIQQSRGCPYTCEFCAERRLNGDYGYRDRPVEDVIEEIRRSRKRHVFFAASQFVGNKARTEALLEALVPLKVRWSALFSPRFGLDDHFIDLAKRSGLLHVNMGIESISKSTLQGMRKNFNRPDSYVALIDALERRNISYSFNFVFGTDAETPDVFDSTLDFLMKHKVPAAYFNLMMPLRGTPVFDRLKAEKRIIDEYGIGRFAGVFCHFRPQRLSGTDLVAEVARLKRAFYSPRSMLQRLRVPRTYADLSSWYINVVERKVSLNTATMNEFSEF